MMKKYNVFTIMVISLVSIFMWGCKHTKKEKVAASPQQVVVAKRQALVRSLNFKGQMNPINSESVISPVDGRVKQLHFSYGDKVKKGQLLLTLDSKSLYEKFNQDMQSYLEKKSSFLIEKQDFMGTKMLYQHGIVAQNQFETSQNSYESNELSFVQAKADLVKIMRQVGIDSQLITKLTLQNESQFSIKFKDKFNNIAIYSPGDGVALFPIVDQASDDGNNSNSDGKLRVGSAVKEGGLILSVGDLSGYAVNFKVNEIQVTQLKSGMPVQVSGDAFPGVTLNGHIAKVASQAAPNAGGDSLSQYDVAVVIPQVTPVDNKKILVGMTCKVRLNITSKAMLMIPISAINQDKNNNSIVSVRGASGKTKQVQVTTGDTTPDGRVAIISGIKEGDKVVVNG